MASLRDAESHADALIARLAHRDDSERLRREAQWEDAQMRALSKGVSDRKLSREKRDKVLGTVPWKCEGSTIELMS